MHTQMSRIISISAMKKSSDEMNMSSDTTSQNDDTSQTDDIDM